MTKYRRTGGLEQQKAMAMVLEAISSKSRCWQGRALSEGAREGSVPGHPPGFW